MHTYDTTSITAPLDTTHLALCCVFFRGFFWPSCCCCPRKWQRTFILVSSVVRLCSFPTLLFFLMAHLRYSDTLPAYLHEDRATQAANKQYHCKWNSPPNEIVNAHVLPINWLPNTQCPSRNMYLWPTKERGPARLASPMHANICMNAVAHKLQTNANLANGRNPWLK